MPFPNWIPLPPPVATDTKTPLAQEIRDRLEEMMGVLYDRKTGKVYFSTDGSDVADTGYSFENATWRHPRDGSLKSLNPLQFATRQTAEKVLMSVTTWIPAAALPNLAVSIENLTAPGRTIERSIVVANLETGATLEQNAGLLAVGMIKAGMFQQGYFLEALRNAGVIA